MTGAIPYHVVALHHAADLGLSGNVSLGGEVELQSGLGGFIITHDGSVEITREPPRAIPRVNWRV
jgi:hypothetical protein